MADEDMADEICNESVSSASTHSIPSTSCKKKPRGPYNQYLSQPGAKIPRTTLKRWPAKNFPTTSISIIASDQLVNDPRSSATCSDSSITNTECKDMIPVESSCSLLHQTGVPSETTCLERDEYPSLDDDNEQSLETLSDQCDLIEGEFEETIKPTESEQATIGAAEDEQEGVEEYLDAFNSDESAGGVDTEEKEKAFEDVPLYAGAPISVAVSMLLIVTFAIRHSLTGLAIVDLLTLVSLHCALPNQCASSMDLLKKFFMKLKNPIQFHYYCTYCMEYQGLSITVDKLCKNRCCLKDLSKKENSSYFLIIPLMCQLRDLIHSKWSCYFFFLS